MKTKLMPLCICYGMHFLQFDVTIKSAVNKSETFIAIIFFLFTTQSLFSQNISNPGFETASPFNWTQQPPTSDLFSRTTVGPKSGSFNIVLSTNSSSLFEMRSNTGISVPKDSFIHIIGWAKTSTNTATSVLHVGIFMNGVSYNGTGINMAGNEIYTRVTYSVQNTSGSAQMATARLLNQRTGGPGAPRNYHWDDIVMYSSTQSIVDTTKPGSASSINNIPAGCNSISITWVNGSDIQSGLRGTGILRTTNLSAPAPVLNDQAMYSMGTIGDWTFINTSLSPQSSSFTDTTVANNVYYKYSIVHYDYGYNYSEPLISGSMVASPNITSSSPSSRCGTGTLLLGATASAGTLNWYATSTGGTSLGTGTVFATPSISTTTTYWVDASENGCPPSPRTAVTATIKPIPTITGTTPAARCATGTVTLGATASAGIISWYDASTGGTLLVSGTGYTTPSISATTTYWVDATNNGCTTGTRTAVTATVTAIPTITGTTPAARCATGTVTLGATASAGTINWYAASTGGSSLGAGTAYTTPSISVTTIYWVDATASGCTSVARTAVTATVNSIPTITGTTPAARCATGTVTLGATASAGAINWYAASTGGSSLGTGIGYTTPSISATTTYWVDATASGCTTGTRTSVTAIVNALPTITGNLNVCVSLSTQLTGSDTPASSNPWVSSNPGVATVSNTGLVTGVSAGSCQITYSNNNGCSIQATVTVRAPSNAVISYISNPYCTAGGTAVITHSGTGGGVYTSQAGLSINAATGAVTLATSTIGTYTVTYTVIASGGCPEFQTSTSITILAPGTWIGSNNDKWDTGENWACAVVPDLSTNVIIPGGLIYYPNINSMTGKINDLNIQIGGSLTITNGILELAGILVNNGILKATNGTVELKGINAQVIPANTFQNNAVKNLVINNSNAAGVSLTGPLDIYGSLSFTGTGKLFVTNDNLTIKSNEISTAWVKDMTGNSITGKVTVERYLPAKKGWRFLSVPTNTSQSISQAWQESCAANANCTAGFGTQITGPGGTSNGFDVNTGTASIKYFNSAIGNWIGNTNTISQGIKNIEGYMVFVRGDRNATTTAAPAVPTILRSKGSLYTGDQTAINIAASKFAAIGNPYPAALDMRNISRTGLKDFFYLWDPQLSGNLGFGAYQTFAFDGGGNYLITPGGGSYDDFGDVSNYIPSGHAFIVQATSSGGSLIFKEEAKSSGTDMVARETTEPLPQMRIRLYGVLADSSTYVADGVIVHYNDGFNNAVDDMDAIKYSNTSENLSLKTSNTLLVVERRQTIGTRDTLFLNLANVRVQQYRFECTAEKIYRPGMTAFLVDNYLQTNTALNVEGSTTINFNIVNVPGSYSTNRFMIVFSRAVVLPVTFTSIKASQKDAGIEVVWKVENEMNVMHYELEKSADGNRFTKIAVIAATGNSGASARYSEIDKSPLDGFNYYRIKNVDIDGQMAYSQVVRVKTGIALSRDISVYPNPVTGGKLNIQFTNQPAGMYMVRISNKLGQTLLLQLIDHAGGSSTEPIRIDDKIPAGILFVEVNTADNQNKAFSIMK